MNRLREERLKREAGLHPPTMSRSSVEGRPEVDLEGAEEMLAELRKPRKPKRELQDDVDPGELREVLEAIPNEDLHFDDWLKVGMAIHDTGVEDGLELWTEWSAKSPKHVAEQCVDRWPSFSSDRNDPVTYGFLRHLAQEEGWRPPKPSAQEDFAGVAGENGAKDSVRNVRGDSPSVRPDPDENGSPPAVRWREPALAVSKGGTPLGTFSNALSALRVMDLDMRFDEFADDIRLLGAGLPVIEGRFPRLGRTYVDATNHALRATLLSYWAIEAPLGIVDEAAQVLALEKKFNPIVEWLDGLEWDGEKRLDSWMADYCEAPDRPYERAVGRALFTGAAARAYRPGIKFDTMIIFEGTQGTSKSGLIQLIGGEYASEGLGTSNLREKTAIEAMQGKWIIEVAELEQAKKADIETLKSFLSKLKDRMRKPWDRRARDFPRRCVFIGTTNEQLYLRDSTGNRRMLPVKMGRIDLEGFARVRDQLFAEAVVGWKKDPRWQVLALPEELWATAAEEQEERFIPDPWEEVIADYLAGEEGSEAMDRVAGKDLLSAVGLAIANRQRHDYLRIATVMRRLGWERKAFRVKGKWVKGYVKPDSPREESLRRTRRGRRD